MRTTIDSAGRLVIPKALRERLHLAGASEVEVTERDGIIEVRPAPREISVDRTGGQPRLVTTEQVPPLTDEDVRKLLDELRR